MHSITHTHTHTHVHTFSYTLSAGLRMHWLYPLQRGVGFPLKKKESVNWEWHQTASGGEAPVLECGVPLSWPLLPFLFWSKVVVLLRVLSMGQIDLFANY